MIIITQFVQILGKNSRNFLPRQKFNPAVIYRPLHKESDDWRLLLANIKSQIKRIRQNEKRRLRNRYFKGRARSFVKRARLSIQRGSLEEAIQATRLAVSALDKAAEKGILHKNNAARRKSRLMKRLAALQKQAAA